jgi:hypothetical protein
MALKQTKKPVAPPGLDERAMLVYLSIGFWEGRRKDADKTAEVLTKAKADADSGNWWTRCISREDIKPVIAARDAARSVHLQLTLPWYDDGQRVLPAAMFFDYTQKMRKLKKDYSDRVAEFVGRYPGLVASAVKRLGDLYDAEAFPSAEAVAGKYPWTLRFFPLPAATDFRVELGTETTAEIRRGIEAEAASAMAAAMGDLWGRLHDGVSRIADRLNDPKGIFRDSLIANVAGLCELLPKMNVTGDPNLENARAEVVAKLSKQDPNVLRSNPAARATAATAAAEIIKTMSAFMPKK